MRYDSLVLGMAALDVEITNGWYVVYMALGTRGRDWGWGAGGCSGINNERQTFKTKEIVIDNPIPAITLWSPSS